MSDKTITGKLSEYGFEWGAVIVERLFSNKGAGWVTIGLRTEKESFQIYVTKTGKVRIHGKDGREWKPQPK